MEECIGSSWYVMLNTFINRERLRTDVLQSLPAEESFVAEEDRNRETAWIITSCCDLNLGIDTMSLAAATLDRVLLAKRVKTKYVNCVAAACLSLAIKFCEESLAGADYLIAKLSLPYSVRELNRMERAVLSALKWDLDVPSVYRFIEAMLVSTGFSPETDLARRYLEDILRFPLEAIVRNASLNSKFRPSLLALSLYSLFLESSGSPFWVHITLGLQRLLKVDQKEMIDCRETISDLLYVENKEIRMAVFDNEATSVTNCAAAAATAGLGGKCENEDSVLTKAKSGRCAKRKAANSRPNYAYAYYTQQD